MTNQALAKTEPLENTGLREVKQGNFAIARQPMSLADVQEWAEVFYKSGMFKDINNLAQAMVKIKAGEELGFSPFVSMGGIHIIQGRASLGATLQASLIRDSQRYRYEVKELTATSCTLEFFEGVKSLGQSTFTMDDAKAAGLTKTDREKGMYEKYARNMLFARALTNGMRWYTPDLLRCVDGNAPMADFDVDETIEETAQPAAQDHIDGEVVEEQVIEPVAEAEPPINPETADLLIAINDEIKRLTGGDVAEIDKLLKGRNPKVMPKEALVKLLAELKDEIPF